MSRLEFDHKPRKRFGQNFLQDALVIEKILSLIHPKAEDKIVEIGPGLGALTKPLLERVDHLDVIEIDRDLARELKQRVSLSDAEKLNIYTQDALKFDLHSLLPKNPDSNNRPKFRIIGNLPYNISTPILFHLFTFAHLIQDMHFMLQKEVVDRLTATPNHKVYGKLSIMAQYFCKIESLLEVPPTAFYPKPQVFSALVRLIPHASLPHPARNLTLLQTVTQTAFNQRRKTLSNALKPYLNVEDFKELNIDPKLRPEALSMADFVKISNYLDFRNNR